MEGLWVRSQDGSTLVFVRTFEVWESGRIVARFGRDYKHLGDYDNKEKAQCVIDDIEDFINTSTNKVYQMPGGEMYE